MKYFVLSFLVVLSSCEMLNTSLAKNITNPITNKVSNDLKKDIIVSPSPKPTVSSSTKLDNWNSDVKVVEIKSNETTIVEGKLEEGKIIDDLSWASNSSVACFPATQNVNFRGNHVFFATKIPPKSILKVKVIPDNKDSNFSLYGYQIGSTEYRVVPNLTSAVSCEAEHKWDRPKAGKTQDHTREILFNSTTNPYNIFIGVTGPKEALAGSFKLEFSLQS